MGTISEKLTYLKGTKADIESAIEGKGVDVPTDTTFRGYGDKIRAISAGMTLPPYFNPAVDVITAGMASEQANWRSVCYGNGLYVAVAMDGTNRIMTSTDGITWTARLAPEQNQWLSVCYGNGLYVAVGGSGTNRVMTSTDGVTWTARMATEQVFWYSVCYGNGLFVAVSNTGTNQVMTSPDGITWTARVSPVQSQWCSVCYGNGLYVAVAMDGTNRIMTSPDGITWTARMASEPNQWNSVCYGNGLYVAVANTGTNRIMTSPDGITWTVRESSETNSWYSVCYGNGLFVAVASDGTNRVMTSPDGITWMPKPTPKQNIWVGVGYGNGLFVIVGVDGINRILTWGEVGKFTYAEPKELLYDTQSVDKNGGLIVSTHMAPTPILYDGVSEYPIAKNTDVAKGARFVTKNIEGEYVVEYGKLENLTSEQIEKLNGIANYNYIINGNFDIWQRGTNFPNATNQYTADRFKLGNIADVSRTTDVPNNLSTYSARIQANSNWLDNPSYFITLLEKPFTGQTVSLSMYIKTDIGYSINISSGGVFLETVNTNGVWKKVEYTFVASSDTAILNILFKPMVAGKGYNIAQVKYELGDQATNFSPRLLAEESIMCQRYYEVKTYIVELPGTPAGDALTHKIGIDCMSKRILPTITQTVGTLINVASLLPFTMGANGVRIDIVPTNMNTHIFAEFTLKIDAEL